MLNPDAQVDAISGATIDGTLLRELINHQIADTPLISSRVRVCDMQKNPQPVVSAAVAAQVSSATSSYNGGIGNGLPADRSDVSVLLANTDLSVTHDSTRPMHRSTTFTTIDPYLVTNPTSIGLSATPWDIYNNLLKISEVMIWPKSKVALEVSFGYFYMAGISRQFTDGRLTYTWSGNDLDAIVSDASTLCDFVVPAGYAGNAGNGSNGSTVNGYLGAIMDLLHISGLCKTNGGTGINFVGNDDGGPAVPYSWMNIPLHGNQTVGWDQLFSAGTNRVQIRNQLLKSINYYPGWWDGLGMLRSSPIPDVSAAVPPISWDYSPSATKSIIDGPIQQDITPQGNAALANQIRAVSSASGVSGQDLSVIVGNFSPNIAVSLKNLKAFDGGPRCINGLIRNDKIPSLSLLQATAQLALQQGSMLSNAIQFNTWHNPLHEDFEMVQCQVTDRTGRVLIPSDPQHPFVEVGWKIDVSAAGRMSHAVKSVVMP